MGSKGDGRLLIDRIVAVYNSRDVDALGALYQPDITYWSAIDGLQEGADAVREHLDHLHETLPDEKMRAQTVITDGDLMVVEFESTGTNPAGNYYTIEFTEVFELDDGKVRFDQSVSRPGGGRTGDELTPALPAASTGTSTNSIISASHRGGT